MTRYLIGFGASLSLIMGAYFYGVHTGKRIERNVWLLVEGDRSKALQKELIESQQELRERTLRVNNLARQNAEQREVNRGLANEVERLIDQQPAVRTVVREVPANCPVFECPLPDIAHDYRVHNCAIDPGTCEGLPDSTGAGNGNDSMPDPGETTTVRR